MSDALDTLARANPVPDSRRQEIEARARARAASWQQLDPVLPRDPRAGRRYAVALVAGLSVLVAVGTALALRADWLDFSQAEPAPPRIVKSFSELDSYAPPGMATGVIASEARRIPVTDNEGRLHTFWVAPTRYGGWCADVEKVGGGCEKLGTVPLAVVWGATTPERSPTRDHPVITQIYGDANARWSDSVAIRFDDGEVVRLPVVWVSAPINAGFFFYEVPPEHRTAGHEPASVEAYDASGNLVTTSFDDPARNETSPPPDARLDDKTEVARAATADGDAVLWTAPTRYDATCTWVEIDGHAHGVPSCLPAGYLPGGSEFRLIPTKHAVVVVGRFDRRLENAVLGFADFKYVSVSLVDGYLLFAIPAQHLTPATQLVEIRATTKQGETAVNIQLPPGMPTCSTPLPTAQECR